MIELTVEAFPLVLPLLGDGQHCVPLNAVLNGKHAGRVFVDDAAAPAAAYVWTPWGYHYLIGTPQDSTFIPALRDKLAVELQPQSAALGEPDMLLTLAPESWEPALVDILSAPAAIKIYRRHFTFNTLKFQGMADREIRIPAGCSMQQIDANLAYRIENEICTTWRSVDDFCTNGFGYCLLADNTIASVCMAAFIARGVVEIGVRTDEKYRRQGYGSLTASALITQCLADGLVPHWECFWDNAPSIALARKLGFVFENDAPIYYWEGPHAT